MAPEPLRVLDKRIKAQAKARDAEQYLLTMEGFSEYLDLWVGSRFSQLRKISNADPQQCEYRWGTAELVEFTSDQGVLLMGRLYKPEGFDPTPAFTPPLTIR